MVVWLNTAGIRVNRFVINKISNMTFRNFYKINLLAILILSISFGCSSSAGTNDTNGNNANKPVSASNRDVSVPQTIPSVSNGNMQTPSSISNINKDSRRAPQVKDPAPQISGGGNDLGLFLKVREGLSAEPDLINSVIVDIKEGNVTLTGKVQNEEKKKKAQQIVENVSGIKNVKNNLRVGL